MKTIISQIRVDPTFLHLQSLQRNRTLTSLCNDALTSSIFIAVKKSNATSAAAGVLKLNGSQLCLAELSLSVFLVLLKDTLDGNSPHMREIID